MKNDQKNYLNQEIISSVFISDFLKLTQREFFVHITSFRSIRVITSVINNS